jgi:hypothetical protein
MAAITSNGTGGGNWTAGASWTGGVVPVAGDTVTILASDTITADANITFGDDSTTVLTINAGGTLTFARTAGTRTFEMRGGALVSGTLDCGTTASPIPVGCNWTFRWGMTTGASLREMIANASTARFSFHGSVRTRWTRLTRDAAVATPTVVYVADATGWQVGDVLGFEDTHNYSFAANLFYPGSLAGDSTNRTETAVISSISGPVSGEWTITLTTSLVNVNADASRNAHHTRSVVANLSSNVVMEGVNATTPRCAIWTTNPNSGFAITGVLFDLRHVHWRAGHDGRGSCMIGHNSSVNGDYTVPLVVDSVSFYDWRQIAAGFTTNTKYEQKITRSVFWGTAASGSVMQTNGGNVIFEDCAFLRRGPDAFQQAGASAFSQRYDRCIFSENYRTQDIITLVSQSPSLQQMNDCEIRPFNGSVYIGGLARWQFNRCTFALSRQESPQFGVGFPSFDGNTAVLDNNRVIHVYNNCRFTEYVGFSTRVQFSRLGDIGAGDFLGGMNRPSNASTFFRVTYSGVNGDPTYQRIITPTGYIKRAVNNAPLLNGATPTSALRFEPRSAAAPLSNNWKLFAPAGKAIIVTAKIYKSSGAEPDPDRGGFFANYTGSAPTLTAVGTQDQASVSVTGANGQWLEVALVYTSTLANDEIITLTLDILSPQGAVWATNLSAPLPFALDTGPQQWWTDGAPVPYIVSNYSVPADTWNVLLSSLTTAGSIGEAFANVEDTLDFRESLRLLLAVVVGDVTGGPSAPVFKSLDGTKDRVVGTATSVGDRIRTSIDPS